MTDFSVDFGTLLSCDNTLRKQAEAHFRALQESHPAVVATQLIEALVCNPQPAVRELCAVLARKELPKMLPKFPGDTCEAIKAGLLRALGGECSERMSRKICDTIGRVGGEYLATGGWPELNQFIQGACAAGEPRAHEAAVNIVQHMAAAIVDSWAQTGASVQGMLTAALAPSCELRVQSAALCAFTAMLRVVGERQHQAANAAYKKDLKAIAAGLQGVLPQMLGVLEGCINASDGLRAQTVVDNLVQVAEDHPRLFKPVLAQVVEGMVSLSQSERLPSECRMSCIELLLTIAEGAPKMCTKMPGFSGRMLAALMPMMLKVDADADVWEESQPEDGLTEGDDDEEGSMESLCAQQGLDRLCTAIGGDEVGPLVLGHLQTTLGGGATWQMQYAAMVSVATLSEHAHDALAPHIASLVGLIDTCAVAAESRVRWAARYCFALLADYFNDLAENHHASLVPHIVNGLADPCARVQSASALAVVNIVAQMPAELVAVNSQPIAERIHSLLSAGATPGYVIFSCATALSMLCTKMGKIADGFYAGFMPLLAARLQAAIAAKANKRVQALVEAIGELAAAATESSSFEADAATLVPGLLELLRNEEHRPEEYLDVVHSTLAKLGKLLGVKFSPFLAALVPALIKGASAEVEIEMTEVEEEDPAGDEIDGVETTYITKGGGKGLVRMRVSAAQMGEKHVALRALTGYAAAAAGEFMPFVQEVTATCITALTYKWSDKARAAAATAVTEVYKSVVLAAVTGVGGVTTEHVGQMFATVVKPMNEALVKELELTAADAMLEGFQEFIILEKKHALGVLGSTHVNALIEVIKRQLHNQEGRVKDRAAEEIDEEEGGAEEDDEFIGQEWNLMCTLQSMVRELLELHGAALCPALDAQLAPVLVGWLSCSEPNMVGIAMVIFSHMLELGGRDNCKKYTLPVLPVAISHAECDDNELRQSAIHFIGIAAEHSGKLFSRGAAADAARKLAILLQAADARSSDKLEASEAAVRALGKLLVHRAASLDPTQLLPLWLSWLPLKNNEDGKEGLKALAHLLETNAVGLVGADSCNLPQLLLVMGRAYEAPHTGAELSQRFRAVLLGWKATNEPLMQACNAALPEQPLVRERLMRMVQ